ncbi:hypothetical protein N7528_003954 [Penicillium herquei]|nr:hypothetical protein N7528_003954 [Penicillium herquei]
MKVLEGIENDPFTPTVKIEYLLSQKIRRVCCGEGAHFMEEVIAKPLVILLYISQFVKRERFELMAVGFDTCTEGLVVAKWVKAFPAQRLQFLELDQIHSVLCPSVRSTYAICDQGDGSDVLLIPKERIFAAKEIVWDACWYLPSRTV